MPLCGTRKAQKSRADPCPSPSSPAIPGAGDSAGTATAVDRLCNRRWDGEADGGSESARRWSDGKRQRTKCLGRSEKSSEPQASLHVEATSPRAKAYQVCPHPKKNATSEASNPFRISKSTLKMGQKRTQANPTEAKSQTSKPRRISVALTSDEKGTQGKPTEPSLRSQSAVARS